MKKKKPRLPLRDQLQFARARLKLCEEVLFEGITICVEAGHEGETDYCVICYMLNRMKTALGIRVQQ